MPTAKVNDFKRYLNGKTPSELKAELVFLFKTFKNVKEYYSSRLQPAAEGKILEYYKNAIQKEFEIRSSGRVSLRFSVMRKAIAEFQKISQNPQNVAELMMTVVEEGIGFSLSLGGISEGFCNSLGLMFRKVVDYMHANNLENALQERCQEAVEASQDIGWGFGDEIAEIYASVFPSPPDTE